MIILEKSGAHTIYLALDNDEAGKKGAEQITRQCNRIFNVIPLQYESADVGCAEKLEIQKMLERLQ